MKKLLLMFVLVLGNLGLVACDDAEKNGQLVLEAKETLKVQFTESGDTLNFVTGDLVLTSKIGKVKITWESDNEAVGTYGKVARHEKNDVKVKLTATLKIRDIVEIKEFDLIVKRVGAVRRADVDTNIPSEYNNLVGDKKVYVTSLGQSGDLITLNFLLSKQVLTETNEFEEKVINSNSLNTSEIEEESIVIILLEPSANTIDLEGEMIRANAFATLAKEGKINLIGVHIGGAGRRGAEYDPLISIFAEEAMLLFVTEGGNYDGFFDNLDNENVYFYSELSNISIPFKQVFNK